MNGIIRLETGVSRPVTFNLTTRIIANLNLLALGHFGSTYMLASHTLIWPHPLELQETGTMESPVMNTSEACVIQAFKATAWQEGKHTRIFGEAGRSTDFPTVPRTG